MNPSYLQMYCLRPYCLHTCKTDTEGWHRGSPEKICYEAAEGEQRREEITGDIKMAVTYSEQ
jgi:hypothetical protein